MQVSESCIIIIEAQSEQMFLKSVKNRKTELLKSVLGEKKNEEERGEASV